MGDRLLEDQRIETVLSKLPMSALVSYFHAPNEQLRDMAYEIYESNGDPSDALSLLIEATTIEIAQGLVPRPRLPLKYVSVGPYDHFCQLRMQVDEREKPEGRARKDKLTTTKRIDKQTETAIASATPIDIQSNEPKQIEVEQLALF